MKSSFFFLLLSVKLFASDLAEDKLDQIRTTYYKSVENESYVDSLFNYLNPLIANSGESVNPLLVAYLGAAESVKAKHAFWPFTKLSYLNESMDTLAKAVSMDENNLEIRFMRFSILHFVPGILGYSEERKSDLTKIIELLENESYSGLPMDIVEGIISFMVESERLNDVQLNSINNRRILTNSP